MKAMSTKRIFVILVGMLFLLTIMPLAINAQVPQEINYQGYLTNSGGNPLNGNYSIQFFIYNVDTGGIALWDETQAVTVADGIYSVRLGLSTSFPADLFDGDLYLGVKVGSDLEMTPRLSIASVAFAMKADDADALDGLDSTSFLGSGGGLADLDESDLLVQGIGSFNTTGDEGILYLGDTNSYIKAVRGYGARIGSWLADNALAIQQETGRVGIGTTEPVAQLHVDAPHDGEGIIIGPGLDQWVGETYKLRIRNGFGDGFLQTSSGGPQFIMSYNSFRSNDGIWHAPYNTKESSMVTLREGKIQFQTGTAENNPQVNTQMEISSNSLLLGSLDKGITMFTNGNFTDIASLGSPLAINYTGAADTYINVSGGNVGIGTYNPNHAKLDVQTSTGTAIYGLSTGQGSAGLYAVSTNDTNNGYHGMVGVTSSDNSGHAAVWAVNHGTGPGIIATAGSAGYAGKFEGIVSVQVLEITGADLSEQYTVRDTHSNLLPTPGKVVSIDPENPGDLVVSRTAYDRKVAATSQFN